MLCSWIVITKILKGKAHVAYGSLSFFGQKMGEIGHHWSQFNIWISDWASKLKAIKYFLIKLKDNFKAW